MFFKFWIFLIWKIYVYLLKKKKNIICLIWVYYNVFFFFVYVKNMDSDRGGFGDIGGGIGVGG